MRGPNTKQSSMLMLMSPETRVPASHPIRGIKKLADAALVKLSPTFDAMYSVVGRPSIPPERLLKATLLMALYTIRSERQFCEQLDYNLLFRWFLDMNMEEESFVPTVFTHNRARLIAHDAAGEFFRAVLDEARRAGLMSSEHFTVDGTLIESAASLKSFKKKDDDDTTPLDDPGNPSVDFHGEKRTNETHESTTDPDAKLARKSNGTTAKLSYSAHALMENRNGLLVDFQIDVADGLAERRMALEMIDTSVPGQRRITLGADRGYDTKVSVRPVVDAHAVYDHLYTSGDVIEVNCWAHCRRYFFKAMTSEPERAKVALDLIGTLFRIERSLADAPRKNRESMRDKRSRPIVNAFFSWCRTSGTKGYAISLKIRKRVEEIFGWMKTVGNFRKSRFVGIGNNQLAERWSAQRTT